MSSYPPSVEQTSVGLGVLGRQAHKTFASAENPLGLCFPPSPTADVSALRLAPRRSFELREKICKVPNTCLLAAF